ncbi:hypothetical protein PF005_g22202 [Phytophthora fragariae]|uniref:RxLR effector protein n=1 Tax=Phytophthora fragariae TaxID=53985 RepID=A0A6A3WNH6_9STRA|nr:hypothetical protein PF003_g18459 [Phytophthora fragariae]KAE8926284.1 hypothetical protein PF009_g23523 [Phytophthora fragariae]KAE9080207.1 hypothetical protein PF010_g22466 [Phytophthora fragariae]KAE9081254.1 hypothetical protein PF007_g22735 [Phytophthora fragariae]KAE9115312.1 hypothetical protein PF006_g19319 [Phytophthora fragariae]
MSLKLTIAKLWGHYIIWCNALAQTVQTLGKFLNCFTHEHPVLAKRVIRYLRETIGYGPV